MKYSWFLVPIISQWPFWYVVSVIPWSSEGTQWWEPAAAISCASVMVAVVTFSVAKAIES